MTSSTAIYLNQMALICALGSAQESVFNKLVTGDCSGMQPYLSSLTGHEFLVGKVSEPLPQIPAQYAIHNTRNNRLVLSCLQQLSPALEELKDHYSPGRIGVVIGTSTSGIAEGEQALLEYYKKNQLPGGFYYPQIEMSSPAQFVKDYLQLEGPAYAISTACSSSGKVFASARSLIENDLCDAVVVGGADSLCDMTLNGFNALEAISSERSQPFSKHRKGINIGEGASLFIMSKTPGKVSLLGVGEASDAHHISAPHPEGEGAATAMAMALQDAGLIATDIDYLNLHGTGTELNDLMEGKAVAQIFGTDTPASSTKPMTGHTLGAAGAIELAFCWLTLTQPKNAAHLPRHRYDGHYDPMIPALQLITEGSEPSSVEVAMSNSFAFGGNNVSVIIARS